MFVGEHARKLYKINAITIQAATLQDGRAYIIYNTRRYELRPADQGGLLWDSPFARVSQKQNLKRKEKKTCRSPRGTPVQVSRDVSDSREHMVAITQRPPKRRLVYN